MKKILLSVVVLAALTACGKSKDAPVTPDSAASSAVTAPSAPASAAEPVKAVYDPNLKPVNIQWKDEATKKRFEEAAAKAAAANKQAPASASQPSRK